MRCARWGRRPRFLGILCCAAYLTLPVDLAAQSDPPGNALIATIPALAIRWTITAAEEEGRTFAPLSRPDSIRLNALSHYRGNPSRTCQAVSDAQAVRVGDFIVGGGITTLVAGRGRKVWWFPIGDPTPRRDGLLLRAARLDGNVTPAPSDTARFIKLDYAYPVPATSAQAFYPGSMTFGLPGRWMVIATAGDNWACAIFNVAPE